MRIKFFSMFDYLLLLLVLLLTSFGIAFIYSSGINSDGLLVSNEYRKQILWAVVGLFVMVFFTLFDYRRFKRYSPYLYAGIIVILIYTRLFGRYVNGARSWLGIGELGIQPSEVGKIVFILFLAWYLERSKNTDPLKRFLIALCILCGPMGIILLQPDLGTASAYLPIFIFMCFIANIPVRYLGLVIGGGLLTIILTVMPVWESEIIKHSVPVVNILTNMRLRMLVILTSGLIMIIGLLGNIYFRKKYYYWISYCFGILTFALIFSIFAGKVLKPYQIQRLIVFIDPNSDPRGSGWNIIQSKIAIGSGNIFGRGFMKGTQSHYRFLPQQSTDFIFSIFSEEVGFAGGSILFAVFLSLLIRILMIIKKTTNVYGTYISSGILGMLFFHFIVNVGMVMGIMPITGIPLPFLSYGGSALITNMTAIGLLMSINYRRLDFKVDI